MPEVDGLALRTGPGDDEYEEISKRVPLPTEAREGKVRGCTWQVAGATTVVQIAAANPHRKNIKVTNLTGTQDVYIGFDATVASTTGDYLGSTKGSWWSTIAKGPIYAISVSAAQRVSVLEECED